MATMAGPFQHESQAPPAKVYPSNANDDVDNPLYKQDHFRMYCLKVVPCSKRYCHDWTTCPFAHPAEKAKRRCPRQYSYTGVACPEMKKNMACPRGDQCPYAHNVFEYWLHPSRYRTQLCNDGVNCKRKICFFAHTLEELRVSSVKVLNPELARDSAFAETGGLDPFVVAQDTGFGLAQPRGAGNANMAANAGAANSAPGFSLQDLQQLTQLHAKLQAASNMGAFSGLATQLQAQHMQNGAGDGTQAAMETLAQALAQQAAGQQMGSPQHPAGQQQAHNSDLVQLISQMLTQQQAQHMTQQQAQQQAAAAAAVVQAQNQAQAQAQAQNHMATLQLLSQLQQGSMGGAYGQGGMGADQFSPLHLMAMSRPGMQHSPAMMQQQLAAQMAAAQGMGMRHQARASPQHAHMQYGGARHSPQQSQHMGGGQQHSSPGPMGGMPSPSAMDAEALAQRLAAMRTSPDSNMAQYGQQQQQQQVRGGMQMPIGPASMQPPRAGSVGVDQLATSPTQSRMPLANGDAASSPKVIGSRSNSMAGAAPMPMPQAASPQGLAAPVADSTATGTSYFSNSHSPASTDSSDAASHRSDASEELHGAVGAVLPAVHGKAAAGHSIGSVASPFHL